LVRLVVMSAHLLAAAAAAADSPSWFWYATRGLGTATLIVLTGTVVLGIVTSTGWIGERTPAFVAADIHRNLSLLGMCLLAAHIITTVLDPFAHIGVRDVIIPVGAAYRPVWLGLGVAAMWVLIAVVASSLLRDRIGPRPWRLIHWAAYGSWPLAVVHGLGTGSDAQAPWLIAVVVSCVVAVVFALVFRLRQGRPATRPIRAAAGIVATAIVVGAGAWAFAGPFQPGWAARAGTPVVKVVAAKPGPVHPGPGGFTDPLAGVLVKDTAGNVQISMRDMADPDLTIAIRSPNTAETLPVVTISRGTKALCSMPGTPGTTLYAVCGKVRLTIAFYGSTTVLAKGGQITGQLVTSGPLN
jgi:methionine sulfoxide reductase heme-binding subunit